MVNYDTNSTKEALDILTQPQYNVRSTQDRIQFNVPSLDDRYAEKFLPLIVQKDGCIIKSVKFSEYGENARYIEFKTVQCHVDWDYFVHCITTNIVSSILLQKILAHRDANVGYFNFVVEKPIIGSLLGLNIRRFTTTNEIKDDNTDYFHLVVFNKDGERVKTTWDLTYKVDTIERFLAIVDKLWRYSENINKHITDIRIELDSDIPSEYMVQDGELKGMICTPEWIECFPSLIFPDEVNVSDWYEISKYTEDISDLSKFTFIIKRFGIRVHIKNVFDEEIPEVDVHVKKDTNISSLRQIANWGKRITHLRVCCDNRKTIEFFAKNYKKPDNVKKLTYVNTHKSGKVLISLDDNTQDIGFENIKVNYTRVEVEEWVDINIFFNNNYNHAKDITFLPPDGTRTFSLRGIGYTDDGVKIQEVDCYGVTPPVGDFLAGPPLEIDLIKIGNMGFVHKIYDDMDRIKVNAIHVSMDDMSYMYTNEDWDIIKLIIVYKGNIAITLPANKHSDVYKNFIERCNPEDKDLELTFVASPSVVVDPFRVYEKTKYIGIVTEYRTNTEEEVLNLFMPINNVRSTRPHLKIRVTTLDRHYADKCLSFCAREDGCIIESVMFSDDVYYIKFENVIKRTEYEIDVSYVTTNIDSDVLLQNILCVPDWRIPPYNKLTYKCLIVEKPIKGTLRGLNIQEFKSYPPMNDTNTDYLKLEVLDKSGEKIRPLWILSYKVDTISKMLFIIGRLHNLAANVDKESTKINIHVTSVSALTYTLQDEYIHGMKKIPDWIECTPRLIFPSQVHAAAEEAGHEDGASGYSGAAVATRLIL